MCCASWERDLSQMCEFPAGNAQMTSRAFFFEQACRSLASDWLPPREPAVWKSCRKAPAGRAAAAPAAATAAVGAAAVDAAAGSSKSCGGWWQERGPVTPPVPCDSPPLSPMQLPCAVPGVRAAVCLEGNADLRAQRGGAVSQGQGGVEELSFG